MNHNASRLRTAVRVAAPAVAALTLTMAFAGPASANPAFVMRSGGEIRFAALPGEQNNVTFSIESGSFVVRDTTSRLFPGPGCSRIDNNAVRCGTSTGVTRILATLGDQADTAINDTSVPSDINGGDGEDRLTGGNGPDRLTDPDGRTGVLLLPSFSGRGGNDVIISRNGNFDGVDCGDGNLDLVLADPAATDFIDANCERVLR